jgi:alkylation response protein AidB-like acyl-CoA dehydrogenase
MHEAARGAYDAAAAGKLGLDERIRLRLATTYAMNEATDASVASYRAAGTTAIMNSQPFERRFRDALSASQHLQAMMPHVEMVGRHILGVDNPIQHI